MYIFRTSTDDFSVVYDESKLTEEQKAKGIKVEELPEIVEKDGFQGILKVRKDGTFYTEYKRKNLAKFQFLKRLSAEEKLAFASPQIFVTGTDEEKALKIAKMKTLKMMYDSLEFINLDDEAMLEFRQTLTEVGIIDEDRLNEILN